MSGSVLAFGIVILVSSLDGKSGGRIRIDFGSVLASCKAGRH